MNLEQAEQLILARVPAGLEWSGSFRDGSYTFSFPELDLIINITPVTEEFEKILLKTQITNRDLPRKVVDKLRADLRGLVSEQDNASLEQQANLIIRVIEETVTRLEAYRRPLQIQIPKKEQNPLDAIDTADLTEIPVKLLGITAQQLAASFGPPWCVTNCENILQRELYKEFVKMQEFFRGHLHQPNEDYSPCWGYHGLEWQPTEIKHSKDEEAHIEQLTYPSMTFHGVRKDRVADVVKNGFITEYQKRKHFSFARPIFCTSDPHSAILYQRYGSEEVPPSELLERKLVVCASLLGAARQVPDLNPDECDDWCAGVDKDGVPVMTAQRSRGLHVVQGKAAVLPVFVLHLEWKGMKSDGIYKYLRSQVSAGPQRGLRKERTKKPVWPGEVQAEKQEKKAHAKKHFTYGFGPGKGQKMNIEEVASRADDEENYGDYQKHRLQGELTDETIWDR